MEKKKKSNVPDNGAMEAFVEAFESAFTQFKQDVNDRFTDIERKTSEASDKAALYIAQRMFDPSREHLAEMSNNPLRTIRPMADANTAGSILDPRVQRGELSLPQVWLESYYRHMRGLRGNLIEKAKELALEEVRREKGEEPYEHANMGEGM